MKQLIWTLTISFFIISCSCDREETCPNSKRPTDANFIAYITRTVVDDELLTNYRTEKIVTDSFVTYSDVFFEPLDTTAESYEWQVGTEAKPRTGKRIKVGFSSSVVPSSPIKVTCIAKKKPDNKCFPNDNGIDSITKFIYFFDYKKEQYKPPIFGKYYGYDNKDTSIKYTIEIFYKSPYNIRIRNICRECETPEDAGIYQIIGSKFYGISYLGGQDSQYKEYPELGTSFNNNCWFWQFNRSYGRLSNEGKEIYIEYEYRNYRQIEIRPDGSKYFKYFKTIFKGTKIN